MATLRELIKEKRELDAKIAKARSKEGKKLIKQLIKEYKIPSSYIYSLAGRVKANPGIYQ